MALNLCPDRKSFMEKLGAGDVEGDMDSFIAKFGPILAENHAFMVSVTC